MKYRIEIQQVFGTEGVQWDKDAQWLETDARPRGLTAASKALKAQVEATKTGAPHRLVATATHGTRCIVEELAYKFATAETIEPAPQYVVEVTDAQGQARQECETLADAREFYTRCVDGAQADPRTGYTRSVSLIGLASGDTYYKWEYQAPQVAPAIAPAETTAKQIMAQVSQGQAAVTLAMGYAVDYAGKRTLFEPGHVVSEKRNKAGRCTALVVSYKDNSVLSFTWSEQSGARYQVKKATQAKGV